MLHRQERGGGQSAVGEDHRGIAGTERLWWLARGAAAVSVLGLGLFSVSGTLSSVRKVTGRCGSEYKF